MRIKASRVCTDNAYSLRIAGGDASAAEYALVVVSYHMSGRIINIVMDCLALVFVSIVHAEILAELLQLTVSAAHTC